MRHGTSQAFPFRMRNPDRVVASAAETPSNHILHVKDSLLTHPIEDTILKPIRTIRVGWIGRTVCSTRNLNDDTSPDTLQELVRPLSIAGQWPSKPVIKSMVGMGISLVAADGTR